MSAETGVAVRRVLVGVAGAAQDRRHLDAALQALLAQGQALQLVEAVAVGGAEAYNKYAFAEGLSPELTLGVFYAGPGTFWTDLKGFEPKKRKEKKRRKVKEKLKRRKTCGNPHEKRIRKKV